MLLEELDPAGTGASVAVIVAAQSFDEDPEDEDIDDDFAGPRLPRLRHCARRRRCKCCCHPR